MLELGKKRTKFGKWLDKQEDINQLKLEEATNLSRPTISKLCNDKNYIPKFSTIYTINKGLKKLKKNVKVEDFLNI
ncbi:helix-turn-helix domain-containing protein [Priestia megaterium]|uniref:helix-turn-helix domain-containing protein n=1 Tax=Priestia megaterium TaxID=1404 RepID=UPI002732289F|nr:helix-turn-helix domain-containing protein [Priestia megaterium]MDP1383383.1 helix-turn-helix domain-containing protein [Priestia megaterium]MDP1427531.1 helix-turn-helix domain-containing protein [Priestia megaterium]